jgi:hypothetical protein
MRLDRENQVMKKLSVLAACLGTALFASQAMAGDYDYDDGCCCAPRIHIHSVVRYHAASVLVGYRPVVQVSQVPVYKTIIYSTVHHYATYGCC